MKRKESRSGQESKYSKKWKYEDQMEFLLPTMKNRDRTSNFETSAAGVGTHFMVGTTTVGSILGEDEDSPESTPHSSNQSTNSTDSKRKKGSDPILEYLKKSAEERTARREERLRNLGSKGEAIDLFFKSMCETTKSLPKKYQAYVKKSIFAVVQEAEETYLGEQEGEDGDM